jgi:hypothetical protein
MNDPYKAAERAYAHAVAELGKDSPHALRSAITAALVAERKGTLTYWWRRFRHAWLLWVGGWEEPNCGGWKLRDEYGWRSPAPTMILRAFTYYGWGCQVKVLGTILVWSWRGDRGIYASPDGTPSKATWWLRKPRWRA